MMGMGPKWAHFDLRAGTSSPKKKNSLDRFSPLYFSYVLGRVETRWGEFGKKANAQFCA
jgi:hypothetical protein